MDDGSYEDEELIKNAISSIYIGEFLPASIKLQQLTILAFDAQLQLIR